MDEHRNLPNSEDQAAAGAEPHVEASAAAQAAATSDAAATDAAAGEAGESSASSTEQGADRREAALRVGKVTVMGPAPKDWYRHWDDEIEVEAPDEPRSASYGKRKLAVVAALVILAAFAGAIGGALATAGFGMMTDAPHPDVAKVEAKTNPLEAQVAQLQSEVSALKASIDNAAKQNSVQIGKTAERLERIEKAQAEPAAKIAKLSEAVDKLRAAPATVAAAAPAPPVTVASAAAGEVTGSIASRAAPKPEVGRLPTIDGWILRDVYNGGAVIEGRTGTYEVFAGDPVPGLGRVDAIRRQDGRWVVVTNRGLIVGR
ncbi:hypothetical protein [Rhodopseudomonas sp. B29]|uniref:hypothetical protein n=1 Tax=Rhodopseudomonas sp. B29 TaxID=95607 RepID=UPI000344B481|nr:hypothetical protein [Rhodopseudomonas sp. B29]